VARIVLPGGEERPLEGDTVTLGRDSANDLAFLWGIRRSRVPMPSYETATASGSSSTSEAPRIAVAVVVPNQNFVDTGAGVAGPIMKAMLEAGVASGASAVPTP
jgi:hypothetical protein